MPTCKQARVDDRHALERVLRQAQDQLLAADAASAMRGDALAAAGSPPAPPRSVLFSRNSVVVQVWGAPVALSLVGGRCEG